MTIKEFSKLCNCTTQTLRYYDQIGLLKPIRVDQYTGYRFYQADQAMEFVRIKSFQEAMFSIEEIKEFISKSDEEILEHFEQKIVEQENKLQRIKEIKMSYRRESEKMNKTIKENQRKVLELSVGDVDVYFALNLVSDFMINDGTVNNDKLIGMIDEIRKRLQEKNVVLPMVHFSDSELLDDGDYMICSKGKLLKQGHKDPDGKTIDKISKELYDLFIETEMR